MLRTFLKGGAAINALAQQAGVQLTIVDAGVASSPPNNLALRQLGIGRGTDNIAIGPAMSRRQAEACVLAGIGLARESADAGADMLGVGEMGIGNTTSAAAITSAITGRTAEQTTGRGTGRTDIQLRAKVDVVRRALTVNQFDPRDGFDVLEKLGGLEIGVLVGVILGGALSKRIVVLDGFICAAAALIAHRVCPTAIRYCIAGHRSVEPGHSITLDYLNLRPLLELDLRLGEGTGAVIAMGIVEAAVAGLSKMDTFNEVGVTDAKHRNR